MFASKTKGIILPATTTRRCSFCGENYRPVLQRHSMVRYPSWRLAGGRQAGNQQIFILSHYVFGTFKIARETSQKDIISAGAKVVPEAFS